MATPQKPAQKKASTNPGFQGVRNAIWIIVVCFILAVCFYQFFLGNGGNFQDGNNENAPLNLLGTVYKGGIVVPVIITLLFTVIALSVERTLALSKCFGTQSLQKFVSQIKPQIAAGDFAAAEATCNKQKGSVANVVLASIKAYKEMDEATGLKLAQKVSRIQQAHEEATQLEMPTLQMNLPIIATIVTLGTLTALFGTVVGMIKSFQALAQGGGGDSLELSTGISEALVNTASGILTSWVAVVSYNFFTNRIDKLTFALDEVGYSIAKTFESTHAE
ncbi:MAG: MotA/TolQ/ExbB proton channel family protein [Bacteroidaceae bacterium]|nr:MotA/TolQ/ExbB proton channel family protein [Bacteroidaceae bacterium]